MGKSAQLGLHTWLPAAMEGPTPVSALIHAATMVTAGVFLLIRTSFLFELSPKVKVLIIVLGALTALLSAATAMFLFDIKRIIAYSTCSQLGYMALACGLAQYNIGLFHLVNHAFFKALLFLTAGAIIHSFNNEQDMRKLGGLYPRMPFVLSAITIGNIAIMGLPFLAGYYSKDLIIEAAYLNGNIFGLPFDINLIALAVLLAAFCTAAYSFRMYYYLFLRRNVVPHHELSGPKSQPFFIQLALGTLMIGSIFIGFVLSDLFQATNDFFYHTNFEARDVAHTYFENEFLPYHIKLLPLFFSLTGFIGGLIYVFHLNYAPRYTQILLALVSDDRRGTLVGRNKFGSLYLWFARDYNSRAGRISSIFQYNYYFNEFYNYIALCSYYSFYKDVFLNIDKGVLETFGPTGISRVYL
jgi:NADH:ubiquinone oxidoreductase subunit 5 (subunit L)/multisubunit Na+/H+ antiporter MnhA subunit